MGMKNKLKEKFPSLICGSCLYTKGRIILQDRDISQERQKELCLFQTKDGNETILLRSWDLARELENLLEKVLIGLEDALFVFPGQGSKEVRKLSQIYKNYKSTEVFAKRYWTPGTDPWVEIGKILPEHSLLPEIKNVIVLDDVISSGQTLKKLYEKNTKKFPNAIWIGGSWISQVPRMKTASGLDGYQKIITGIIVWGPQRIVPINSIRSLIDNPEIAQVYAKRHFQNPRGFLDWLSSIKGN